MHEHLRSLLPDSDRPVRQALYYSIWDAALWSIMFGFAETYLVPFALLFGATAFQVSIMQGSAQFCISISQLTGASLMRRYRSRRSLLRLGVSGHGLSWFFVFFLTVITGNVWFTVVFFALGIFAANIGSPAWLSWMNDLVPADARGRYWGFRNRTAGLVQFAAISLAGLFLNLARGGDFETAAFGLLFITACLARMACIIPINGQFEPAMALPEQRNELRLKDFIANLPSTNFGRFCLFAFAITFSTFVMGPLVPVFLLRSLDFDYVGFMAVMMTGMVMTFLGMGYWGKLADRYGNYSILKATAIGMPVVALAFVLVKSLPGLIVVQVFSGFIWSGFNLASLNFVFDSVRREDTPKIMAYYNSFNNLSAFAGSLFGGWLTNFTYNLELPFFAPHSFELIFLLSALLRLTTILVFARGFDEVRKTAEVRPSLAHLYIHLPLATAVNAVGVLTWMRPRREERQGAERRDGKSDATAFDRRP